MDPAFKCIQNAFHRGMEFLYYQDLLTKTYGQPGVVQQLLSKRQPASAGFEKAACIAEASLLRPSLHWES